VAAYTIPIPDGASAQVQFGTNTTYGLSTSVTTAPSGGEVATIYVAGMLQSTMYHMQATVNLPGGTQYKDGDQTFTTGPLPPGVQPNITTELTGNGTPADGVELLNLTPSASDTALCALATDLSGNVIWYYALPTGAFPEPLKQLPNGHMLMVTEGPDDVREIDLAGNMIHQATLAQIGASLAKIVSWQVTTLNHDVLMLPNGHLILLASINGTANNVPGVADGTIVQGNALIDWDWEQGATWTWSTFDHLNVSYAPYGLPDWTHGNALLYSPDDGNLFFSMRNQNWIIKINYQDGQGDGSILWRFGPGGDFTLPNGQAPIDWNYGQHYITLQSPNSTGIFSIMFFDNGNNRLMDSNGDVCGTNGVGACYSSVPIFQLDENAKTASLQWQANLLPAYSICCGDALVLPNGDVEADVAADVNTPNQSYVEELTQTDNPALLWKMTITGQLAYRAFRIPSLYPGVTWPSYATQNLRKAANAQK
jgi:arylsulfate sulfotransferase